MNAGKVKARDLMQKQIVSLSTGTPVDEAVSILEQDRVSGAPVIDGAARVVGVFSLTDVARAKDAEARGPGAARSEYYMPVEGIDEEADEFSYKEDYSPETLPGGTVAEWMSEQVVAVAPGDSVRTVCRRMSDHGIHRLLVLEEGNLVGILSSSDVVRWIADGD